MDVSKNSGTPKSSLSIGVFHDFHHPFWGTIIFGNTLMDSGVSQYPFFRHFKDDDSGETQPLTTNTDR